MGDIKAEQRAKAKAAAANAAVASNDAAVVLGALGAVVVVGGVASGVGALAGVGVGGALAVCSFGAWFIGNRYQRLANDPPRQDFDQVTTSSASIVEAAIPVDEPDATVARLAAQQLILADAMSSLVTSLERFDGAIEAGDEAAASTQADAAQQNATAAAAAQDALVALADGLNEAWNVTRPLVDWSSVSIDQVQQAFNDAVGDGSQAPGGALQTAFASVTGLADPDILAGDDVSSHPVLVATQMPSEPDTIFDVGLLEQLSALSEPLRDFVSPDNA